VQKKVATAANVGESLWIPYVGAALGAMLAGVASDKLIRASGRTVSSRLKIMFCSVVIMPVGILVLRAETLWGVLAVLCAVLAGHMAWKTNLTALTADCFPGRIVGRVESLFSVGSGLGGMMFFVYVGAIVEKFSYTPIFVILAVVHPCAFFLLWLTLRHVDPPQCSLAPPSMSNRYAERGPAM
jgi:ACS family hexuronate transporter-like MFS transporter